MHLWWPPWVPEAPLTVVPLNGMSCIMEKIYLFWDLSMWEQPLSHLYSHALVPQSLDLFFLFDLLCPTSRKPDTLGWEPDGMLVLGCTLCAQVLGRQGLPLEVDTCGSQSEEEVATSSFGKPSQCFKWAFSVWLVGKTCCRHRPHP